MAMLNNQMVYRQLPYPQFDQCPNGAVRNEGRQVKIRMVLEETPYLEARIKCCVNGLDTGYAIG